MKFLIPIYALLAAVMLYSLPRPCKHHEFGSWTWGEHRAWRTCLKCHWTDTRFFERQHDKN